MSVNKVYYYSFCALFVKEALKNIFTLFKFVWNSWLDGFRHTFEAAYK